MNKPLKIAYISYEYPTYTGGGGIGTYIYQISNALAKLGHYVEVFCGSKVTYTETNREGVVINYIQSDTICFKIIVCELFIIKHQLVDFNLIESAEYGADALFVKKQSPNIPLIVKLHAPSFIFYKYSDYHLNYQLKKHAIPYLKYLVLSLICKNKVSKVEEEEIDIVKSADIIYSPTLALASEVTKRWKIKVDAIIPNIYNSDFKYSNIKIESNIINILFISKLSIIKGSLELIKILNHLIRFTDNFKITVVGPDMPFQENESMKDYIRKNLNPCINIEFTGKIPLNRIPEYFEKSDIFICPSLFENFPTVLLEAASYFCPVVAYNVGGIPEIIKHKFSGLLVSKFNHKQFAKSIFTLMQNPKLRNFLLTNAYNQVKGNYRTDVIAEKVINLYLELVNISK
jgi:glycogen synthase